MEIHELETSLNNPDFQYRLKAIAALKDYPAEVAVPLLTSKVRDSEFLVRSFVAMGLGKQQTAESFAILMQMMKFDNTPNVRAEAANSLSLFGRVSASHLVKAFFQDDHWLVRRTILAALVELECPDELLDVCVQALNGEDLTVQAAAVGALSTLAASTQHTAALSQLLIQASSESPQIRVKVAQALKQFDDQSAKDALIQLRQDTDHRVVGAAMESLLPR